MVLNSLLHSAIARLSPAVGSEGEARAMIYVIIEHLKGYRPVDCVLRASDDVTPWLEQQVMSAVDRVEAGEPLQYVLGTARFMGYDLTVTPDTLIPRPETAMLVDMITDRFGGRSDLRVLDIGTGTGCIAIALARALKFADVTATDISEGALDVARRNVTALKVQVRCICQDILSAVPERGTYDIIVSNPPYIARSETSSMDSRVKDYEPELALFVPDNDPLRFYKAIAAYAATALSPGGMLFLEINPLFADGLRALLLSAGFTGVELLRDFNETLRFAIAKSPDA